MNHKRTFTIEVDLDRANKCDQILALKVADPGYKENDQIDGMTVTVSETYEIDFNLYNGNEETGPWLDAILFDTCCEVMTLDPVHESITGTSFTFNVDDENLTIIVIVKNKEIDSNE